MQQLKLIQNVQQICLEWKMFFEKEQRPHSTKTLMVSEKTVLKKGYEAATKHS